jgi:hypothetical protein
MIGVNLLLARFAAQQLYHHGDRKRVDSDVQQIASLAT